MFADRYIHSVNSSDLRDDDTHHATDALAAAALADTSGGGLIGSLLCRVKYADGVVHKTFESGVGNLAQLVTAWTAEVTKRGRERKWVRIESDRDIQTAHALFKRVSEKSLAHWLNPNCTTCNGSKLVNRMKCNACNGTGAAAIECSSQYELGKVKDMVSELEGIYQAHSARAGRLLRRAA